MSELEQPGEESWVVAELGGVELGDKRLNWRLLDTASKLAGQPPASIPQACDDWADTKATYRLFDNKKVTAEKVLQPHFARTAGRMAGQALVLVVQDTSYLDYTHHPKTADLGPIGTEQQQLQGLVMHSALFLTVEGLPLGLGSQRIWVRAPTPKQLTPQARGALPITEKESNKWLTALVDAQELVPAGTQAVHVGDSEADIYDLFVKAQDLKTDLLVRAAQDRSVVTPAVGRLWGLATAQPPVGTVTVEVQARPPEPPRTATVVVRFCPVPLRPPQNAPTKHPPVHMHAVLVREEAPPAGVTPLEWLLLTSVPVHTVDDALERIRWYCQRWQIEVYHKVLKSGCRIEACQLTTAARLIRCVALCSIISWRLLWMTHIHRQAPHAPCTLILTEHEWRALYAHTTRSPHTPPQPPTVGEVVLWIAQLGGFLARRRDGPPGVTVIWRGWQRLNDIADTWLIYNPPKTCG
jgi:hypothetical protein